MIFSLHVSPISEIRDAISGLAPIMFIDNHILMQQQTPPPRNADIRERMCPSCGGTFPSNFGYTDWCHHCNWNLEPQKGAPPKNIFEAMQIRLGARLSKGLIDEMLAAGSVRPRLTISKILAYAIAGMVHGITLVIPAIGIILIVRGWPNILAIIGGIIALLIAIAARPRINKVPEKIIPRERMPGIYKLADDIADALGTSRLAGIIVDADFNAYFFQAGWRQRKYMGLGIPLCAALTPQEIVSLIGHEIAHGANGDSTRGLVVGTAIRSLLEWHEVIRPESIYSKVGGMGGLVMIPVNLMMYGVAGIIHAVVALLARLLYRNKQRAEYLADYLGGTVAGRSAAISKMEKLYLGNIYRFTIQKFTAGAKDSSGFFQEFHRQISTMPEREMDRLRRVSRMETSSLDATHPPTAYRTRFLEGQAPIEPRITLSEAEADQIRREIASFYAEAERTIVEEQRAYLYRMR